MNEELVKQILVFRENRNWEQFHNPKDLAISLSIEASELLENFQWKSSGEAVQSKKEQIADELADVLVYAVYLAQSLGLDLEDIIFAKLKKNEAKYPIEKAFGKKDKYTDL
ncbi:nucleotide pyrophosphohydrolase [Paenibacillus sp. FSL H7-0716]|uniref:Nucleotide pyrophosphohydrolase n=1 Tax=Paenibacillus odorifer TaxID=189426 RepID=A0AB36JEH1_9BACL|nr:nucleotide pyrophosphohydrolase [Paenibacillus odorifer]OME16031.1 nucleotide pyrophosphohydrolase [Paenibacillus odorifer]